MARDNPLDAFILSNGFCVFDGGLATELEAKGQVLNDHLWSARLLGDDPDLIRETHLSYFRAGADVATTASYQASFDGFERKGWNREEASRLMTLSVQLASDARDIFSMESTSPKEVPMASDEGQGARPKPAPVVAASLGSYGASLADGSEYRGNYSLSVDELREWHRDRVAVLSRAGADLLMFETIPCVKEVRAVLELLKDFSSVRAIISVSLKDGEHLRSGEPLLDAASVMHLADTSDEVRASQAASSVVGFGINCTSPDHISRALCVLAEAGVAGGPHRSTGEGVGVAEKGEARGKGKGD
ncbi:unnamed protein product, partial [Discosporangium mesarthrocarpum]